jgi:hypothetical protein
VPAIHD